MRRICKTAASPGLGRWANGDGPRGWRPWLCTVAPTGLKKNFLDSPSVIGQRVDAAVHPPAEEEVRRQGLQGVPVGGHQQSPGDRAHRIESPLRPPEALLELLPGHV